MGFKEDLTGRIFGRLKVIKYHGSDSSRNSLWLCRCVCGKVSIPRGRSLKGGRTNSCGCYRLEQAIKGRRAKIVHGQARAGAPTEEYRAYIHAKMRCENSNEARYFRYGGRGIRFLFKDFIHFYSVIGEKPLPKMEYSLDRIDNNGNYEEGNVRWATWTEQRLNQERQFRK